MRSMTRPTVLNPNACCYRVHAPEGVQVAEWPRQTTLSAIFQKNSLCPFRTALQFLGEITIWRGRVILVPRTMPTRFEQHAR